MQIVVRIFASLASAEQAVEGCGRAAPSVIAKVDAEEQAATARSVFKQEGSEDVDRARKELGKAA